MHRSDPVSRLVFVGPVDPALRDQLQEEAEDLGVDRWVTFAGETDDAYLPRAREEATHPRGMRRGGA